jgi:hypothetical protein
MRLKRRLGARLAFFAYTPDPEPRTAPSGALIRYPGRLRAGVLVEKLASGEGLAAVGKLKSEGGTRKSSQGAE